MACPFCGGENFKVVASIEVAPSYDVESGTLNNDAVWKNQCEKCGEFSYYNESTEQQTRVI